MYIYICMYIHIIYIEGMITIHELGNPFRIKETTEGL